MALARLRQERAQGALTLNRRWLATFLGPVAALLVVGVLLSGLATGQLLAVLSWLLTPLFLAIELLRLALLGLLAGFAWLWTTIQGWFDAGPGTVSGLLPTPAATAEVPRAMPTPEADAAAPPAALPGLSRYLGAGALLAAVAVILLQLLRRGGAPVVDPEGERRESVFRWRLLGAALARPFRRPRRRGRADPLAGLRGDPRWRHTLAIRETYRRLLRRGAAAEAPRAPAQTPDEYAPALARRFDAAGDAVAAITARYDAARYSDRPATAEEAAAVRAAWEGFDRARRPPERRRHPPPNASRPTSPDSLPTTDD